MRTEDFSLSELDVLINKPSKTSIDPGPSRTIGMDPRIVKDLVSDHIRALRNINKGLPRSESLDAAMAKLEEEYMRMFGQRLTELLNAPASRTNAAVLELRRRLKTAAVNDEADLSYDGIDAMMHDISEEYGCAPNSLHDLFVETFNQTPDDYAHDQRKLNI
jgi:hypothetical protein